MALGSAGVNHRLPRISAPLRSYIRLELLLAASALVIDLLIRASEGFFLWIDTGSGTVSALMIRILFLIPLLLLPTLIMGATLPLVLKGIRSPETLIGSHTAQIYGWNTLGAAAGAYAVTFWLIPELGMKGSVAVALFSNLIAAGFMFLARRSSFTNEERESSLSSESSGEALGLGSEKTAEWKKVSGVTSAIALLSGFAFLGMEVIWTRVFSVLLNGTLYGVGSVLIAVLIALGLGSLGAVKRLAQLQEQGKDFGPFMVFNQFLLIANLMGWLAGALVMGFLLQGFPQTAEAEGRVSLHMQLVLLTLFLAGPTVSAGAAFPLLVRRLESPPRVGPGHHDVVAQRHAV
jgi:spermidine synthase